MRGGRSRGPLRLHYGRMYNIGRCGAREPARGGRTAPRGPAEDRRGERPFRDEKASADGTRTRARTRARKHAHRHAHADNACPYGTPTGHGRKHTGTKHQKGVDKYRTYGNECCFPRWPEVDCRAKPLIAKGFSDRPETERFYSGQDPFKSQFFFKIAGS